MLSLSKWNEENCKNLSSTKNWKVCYVGDQ